MTYRKGKVGITKATKIITGVTRMTDARIVAAGFYRACDHSYIGLCPDCATARVRAIREEAVKETREWEGW